MQTIHTTASHAGEDQFEKCNAYILGQLHQLKSKPKSPPGFTVTISYETGAGAHEIAVQLAKLLQATEPKGPVSWTVFDRNLVEKVLEEHHLPKALAQYMPEDRRSLVQDIMEELGGLRPPSWVMVPQIAETVLHLANAGHVILVGRGANFITTRLPNVFHVRLICPLPKRIARVQDLNHLTPKEAAKFIKDEDHARRRYVKTHFHKHIEDDLFYHLVINTDRIPCPDAAGLIVEGMRRCFPGGVGGKV